jgi:hypothetical protein
MNTETSSSDGPKLLPATVTSSEPIVGRTDGEADETVGAKYEKRELTTDVCSPTMTDTTRFFPDPGGTTQSR